MTVLAWLKMSVFDAKSRLFNGAAFWGKGCEGLELD
jgi:hypothetical protein